MRSLSTVAWSRSRLLRRGLLALAGLLAALVSCVRAGGGVTPAERTAIAQEIDREVREAYDLSKPNVDERMLRLYGDSGRIVSATGGQIHTSRDSLAAGIHYFWRNIGMNMRQPKWIWDTTVVDVLAPDAAVFSGTYHVPHLTPRNQPHVIGGAMTMVFQKRGGRWVVVQEHLSDLPRIPDDVAADSASQRDTTHAVHRHGG